MRTWRAEFWAGLLAGLLFAAGSGGLAGSAAAQTAPPDAAAPDADDSVDVSEAGATPEPVPGAGAGETRIRLNFPANTPISTLIEFVATRLELNILYDEAQVNQRLTLRTPAPIPERALLDLLNSALRAKNLVLEETPIPRTLRILPSQQMGEAAKLQDPGLGGAVTEVFPLEHARVERVVAALNPFLSRPGGNLTVLPEEQILIVTDFAQNLERIRRLVALVDVARGESVTRAIPVVHSEARELLELIQPVLRAGAAGRDPRQAQGLVVMADPRTSQILVAGLPEQVRQVEELVHTLDVERGITREVYRPQMLSPERLDRLIQQVLDREPSRHSYRAAADRETGTLVVTAPQATHRQIASLLAELDIPPAVTQSPVRFYRLTNTIAQDVFQTLTALEGSEGLGTTAEPEGRRPRRGPPVSEPIQLFQLENDEAVILDQTPPEPVPNAEPAEMVPAEGGPGGSGGGAGESPLFGGTIGGESVSDQAPASVVLGRDREAQRPIVAVDENTNSIIVIAPPAQQRLYEQIIQELDRRRPQVLIETTIVSLDTTGGFSFGVEIAAGEEGADGRILTFSAFGLSDLDPETPSLAPGVAEGGTIALLSPDIADVVVRALSTSSRSRLVSIPRVLVNDNQEATLNSALNVPYQQTVVPSQSGPTLSSAAYAEAGTTITVSPHISEGDYLQLKYNINLSSFTATSSSQGLPPPRQTNTIESQVTIPDGYTIVVGGLNMSSLTETVSRIPLLGDIPLVKHLFRSTTQNNSNTTLFVFIRPTILRDERFDDLKYLSGLDRERADVAGDFPASEPMLIDHPEARP